MLYDELKNEKEILYQEIVSFESAQKQLAEIKNFLLVREIKTELIGLPEAVKSVIISGYDELVEATQKCWVELVSNEENNLKALVADKKQRIKVIESDVKFVNGEKYYKENETIKQMSIRLSEERKKEERLTKINTKQTEIIEQISLSKERIFEKQRMYYELGQQICGQIQLEKDELSIKPKLSYNQEKLQMFVDSYLNARNPLAKAMQEADM